MDAPLLVVVGPTASGKTAAACAIVSRFRHNGLVVDAFKSTGVALRRDILAMEDSGARHIAMFSDFGICATTSKNAPALTRSLLNELSDEKPDAIVVSIPDADALKKPVMDAKAAGIPVGVIDSGQDQVHDWGLDLWVGGGSEYDNGVKAGEIMGKAGVKHTVCVNHEVGNVSLDDRCRGFKDGLAKNGGATSDVLPASMDPTDTVSRVEAYLSSHPDTDAILALGPSAAAPIMQRLQQMGLLGKIKMGTFDLSPEVLEAIDKGDLMFGIDSQQYLMGYLPVVFFTMKAMYGTLPTADVMTGPAFIMKGDAAKVLALSKEGIR